MFRKIYLIPLLASFVLTGCATVKAANTQDQKENDESSALMAEPQNNANDKGYYYFATSRPATGNRVFIFDPNYDAWVVYDENGKRLNEGKASGGSLYCPDIHRPCKTIVGQFKVLSKEGAGCISHRFPLRTHGGAPMPYCMYFSEKGYAIHGSYEVPNNGNASHGCIRITPGAAKWLSSNFIQVGTTVIVLPYKKD